MNALRPAAASSKTCVKRSPDRSPVAGGTGVARVGRLDPAGPGLDGERPRSPVLGARQQRLRVDAQAACRIALRHARPHVGAAPGRDEHRLPADAPRERVVANRDLPGAVRRSGELELDARRLQAALPLREADPASGRERERRRGGRRRAPSAARRPRRAWRRGSAPRDARAPGTSGSRPGRGRSGRRCGPTRRDTRVWWLIEKLPSGWADAGPAAASAASRTAPASSRRLMTVPPARARRAARRAARTAGCATAPPSASARARSGRPAARALIPAW